MVLRGQSASLMNLEADTNAQHGHRQTIHQSVSRITHSGNQSLISFSADSTASDPWHTLRPTLNSITNRVRDERTQRVRVSALEELTGMWGIFGWHTRSYELSTEHPSMDRQGVESSFYTAVSSGNVSSDQIPCFKMSDWNSTPQRTNLGWTSCRRRSPTYTQSHCQCDGDGCYPSVTLCKSIRVIMDARRQNFVWSRRFTVGAVYRGFESPYPRVRITKSTIPSV